MPSPQDPSTPVESPVPRLPPVIPDHRCFNLIDRGSYGEVWLAENTFGTRRAVKVVYRDWFERPEHYQRELDGVRCFEPVSRSHDAVVDVLQVGQNVAEGWFHYVMELADNANRQEAGGPTSLDSGSRERQSTPPRPEEQDPRCPADAATAAGMRAPDSDSGNSPNPYAPRTLRSELAARGRLPVMECARIGVRLAEALEHLHSHGLVHRDIKPSNVIFVRGVPKLADIGLVSPTGARSFVGTEGYVAPEGPGRPAADLFSLGKVLYESATGKDRRDFPQPPTDMGVTADASARADLNQILLKACELNPANRYQRATELKQELLLLLAGKSLRELRRLQNRLLRLRRIGVLAAGIALAVSAAYLLQFCVEMCLEAMVPDRAGRQRRLLAAMAADPAGPPVGR